MKIIIEKDDGTTMNFHVQGNEAIKLNSYKSLRQIVEPGTNIVTHVPTGEVVTMVLIGTESTIKSVSKLLDINVPQILNR